RYITATRSCGVIAYASCCSASFSRPVGNRNEGSCVISNGFRRNLKKFLYVARLFILGNSSMPSPPKWIPARDLLWPKPTSHPFARLSSLYPWRRSESQKAPVFESVSSTSSRHECDHPAVLPRL